MEADSSMLGLTGGCLGEEGRTEKATDRIFHRKRTSKLGGDEKKRNKRTKKRTWKESEENYGPESKSSEKRKGL